MLPDLDLPTWIEVTIVLGAAATAVGALVALMSRTVSGVKILDRIYRTPDGLDDVRAQLDRIEQQLTSHNSGSLREQVEWIGARLDDHLEWADHVLRENQLTDPDTRRQRD